MFRIQNIPLKVVLVVPFMLELVVAVGLTAYIAYRHGHETTSNLANQLMVKVSDRIEDHLESYFELPVQMTNDQVVAIELGLLKWNDSSALEQYFWSRLQNLSNTKYQLRSFLLVDEQKNLVSVEKISQEGWLLHKRNTKTKQQIRSQLLDLEGKRSQYDVHFNSNQDPLQEKIWYPRIKQSPEGSWHIISTTRGIEHASLAAAYLKPFWDTRRTFRGVTGASIDLDYVSDYLESLNISPRGQAFIIDRAGELVASSTGEVLTARHRSPSTTPSAGTFSGVNQPGRTRLPAVRSLNSAVKDAARQLSQEFNSFYAISDEQQLGFEVDGRHYFLQVTPLQNPKNLNWLLVVVIPRMDFEAQLDRQYHTMFVLLGLALIGAIGLGLATAQRIARPILRLSHASRDLMLGKLDAPVDEQTRIAELAVLAHSFNEMTEQLMESFDQVRLALQESKEKFTTVFRTSPDPIMVSTLPEGTILEVNESFLRLTGHLREQVIGRTAIELGLWTNLEDRKRLMQTIEEIGRVYNQEVSTLTLYGTHVTVLLSSEKIELDGKLCLLTVAKDITVRKQVEEALRLSEERFRLAFDTAAIGMDIAALDGQLVKVNPALCQMLGYSEAELLQRSYQDITHPDDHEIDNTTNWRILAGEVTSLSFEKRFIHKDGQIVWALVSLALIRDLQQQPLYWVAQVQNITAWKQIEAALQRSESRFRAVFETASVGIAIADLEGNIAEANDALCRICGFPRADLQQMKIQQIIHPDDLQRWSKLVQELNSQWLDHYPLKVRCVRKERGFIETQLTTLLIRDAHRQPLYLVTRVETLPANLGFDPGGYPNQRSWLS